MRGTITRMKQLKYPLHYCKPSHFWNHPSQLTQSFFHHLQHFSPSMCNSVSFIFSLAHSWKEKVLINANTIYLYCVQECLCMEISGLLTLIWVVLLILPPPPCWVSLNKTETVKAVTLAFSTIQIYFIRDFRTKSKIPNLPQSPDIGQNSDRGISDFQISGQSLIRCHNSRTSHDIGIKLGQVTKPDKRNKTTSKSFDDDVMLENCDVIAIVLIYSQFGAIRKPDSEGIVCKLIVSLIVIFYLKKTENKANKSQATLTLLL